MNNRSVALIRFASVLVAALSGGSPLARAACTKAIVASGLENAAACVQSNAQPAPAGCVGIWTASLDGCEASLLYAGDNLGTFGVPPQWNQCGSQVRFTAASTPSYVTMRVDADGTHAIDVPFGYLSPDWSWVVTSSNDALGQLEYTLQPADGSGVPIHKSLSGSDADQGVGWAPNSHVFEANTENTGTDMFDGTVIFDTSLNVVLDARGVFYEGENVAWRSDSSGLLESDQLVADGSFGTWLLETDGTLTKRSNAWGQMTLSPNDDDFAVQVRHYPARDDLWVGSISGALPDTQIWHDANTSPIYYPFFSPDGAHLLTSAGPVGGAFAGPLYTLGLDGNNLQKVSDAAAGNVAGNQYYWSPGGGAIAYKGNSIYVASPAGPTLSHLTQDTSTATTLGGWSLGGKRVVWAGPPPVCNCVDSGPIFSDSFESCGTAAWDVTVGGAGP